MDRLSKFIFAHYYISKNEIKKKEIGKIEYIISVLIGIFVGLAVAGYMFVDEINKRDRKIANKEVMIQSRNNLIDYQCNKLDKVKAILNSNEIFTDKYDKIKELFADDQSIK